MDMGMGMGMGIAYCCLELLNLVRAGARNTRESNKKTPAYAFNGEQQSAKHPVKLMEG